MLSWKKEKNLFVKLAFLGFVFSSHPLPGIAAEDAPTRVVALAPSLGELAAEFLGEASKKIIVGVSASSDFPILLKTIESVGPFHQFNLEKVLSLHPDLVLATLDGNPKDRVERLRNLGVPVVVVDTSSYLEIEKSMQTVANHLGRQNEGKEMVSRFKAGLTTIRNKFHSGRKPRIMIQLSTDPLVVVGNHTFLQESIEILHGENVYANSDIHYPRPSIEDVLTKNPDIIVIPTTGQTMGNDIAPFKKMADQWKRFPKLSAVKNKKIRIIQSDALLRPTLRLLEGLAVLEKSIYDP